MTNRGGETVSKAIAEAAQYMLWDFQANQLIVSLAPSLIPEVAERGGKIRVVESSNPEWYQEFCADWPANRKRPRRKKHFDTRIKRSHTERALKELAAGRANSKYAQRLIPVVKREMKRWSKIYKGFCNEQSVNGNDS